MSQTSALKRIEELAARTPKDADLVVFVGRATGLFIDNVKYAFLHAIKNAPHLRCKFMTFSHSECKDLLAHGLPAFCFEDPDGPVLLSQAGIIVCDDFWWKTKSLAQAFTLGSFLVQLWHGIPLKAIGFPEIESSVNMNPVKARELMLGYSGYDAVLSTSPFFTQTAFGRAFRADAFWELGYPRNDVLQRESNKLDLINVDTTLYGELKSARRQGARVVFYMPTFRDLGGNALTDGALDPYRIGSFAQKHNIIFVCKFHPYEDVQAVSNIPNFCFCPPQSDPYPILRLVDLLITDYSSIYFDFLLTGKPILFFPYDRDAYVTRNRELLFDYDAFTPGPKVHDTDGLMTEMLSLLNGNDDYIGRRAKLRRLAFVHEDAGAGERLLAALTDISQALAAGAPDAGVV